ncbi:nad dependent epimerase dehydratase family protein [Colletotrichum karsti]|uniref:Nad dependent epimerase dehydratase family protein n=1 Tax=Colletotrichum karsti TaxID=1095194 RepID=A0A9P6LKB3_9PEZI|nr:nad dependent epimerase dehydratase family protein [Colletotrichum karsti]KAF9876568.1 nad dependent epimerase dehydratase family protein [Colletotrichum karsti]
MSHNILITGASGYLGGTLLARWAEADLKGYDKLYALVRTDEQAAAVKKYGAEPLTFSLKDETAVSDAVLKHQITIVYYLIDAVASVSQQYFIKALGDLKRQTGLDVHFLHTSGAKMFSSHAGAPTDRPLLDTHPELYDIQKAQKAAISVIQPGIETNKTITDEAEANGVKSYIFAPCIVYGKNEGFGNPISIQTREIVKAAKAAGRVYSVTRGRPTWPVCHVVDNATLYLQILRSILNNENPGSGRKGYYLASPGSVVWDDIYASMAKALYKRGVIETDEVVQADENALGAMAQGMGVDLPLVELGLAGKCTFTAKHGSAIGWKPQYTPEHIIESADAEVELILQNLS